MVNGEQIYEQGISYCILTFVERATAGHNVSRQPSLEKAIEDITTSNPLLGKALHSSYETALMINEEILKEAA